MRLICPNCDAQYEVVADIIPTEGRDVQCSNCGQTWFQHHPDHMPDDVQDDGAPDPLAPAPVTPSPNEERAPTPEPEPQRRELDPSVADILRQEAEQESKAREPAGGIESQPDLGLDESVEGESERRARESRERMASMRDEEVTTTQVSEAAATAAALGSRRDLLPDIEEINSTLRSTGDRQSGATSQNTDATSEVNPPRASGFRRGFMFMILLAVLLILLYVFAPQIAQAVPQVDPLLSAFVAKVDVMRSWLDGQVTGILLWLDTTTAQASDG